MSTATHSQHSDAAAQWTALAPRLAARGRMRLSPDGGRNYPRRGERPVTTELPAKPAAVLLYNEDGCAPVLVLDLDTGHDGTAAVDHDFRSLSALLNHAGVSWFSDSSPSGGRHIYIPLATPLPLTDAKQLLARLKLLHPTLDPLPLAGIAGGCVRPPGAWHRTGGHQLLHEPLHVALDALDRPTNAAALKALTARLPRTATVPTTATHAESVVPRRLTPLRGFTQPDDTFQQIARTGDGWQDRYDTPSEARQAVMWSAAASGWRLTDVLRRLEDGTWAGLRSFYARYSPTDRRKAIARDWHRAVDHEKQRREQPQTKSVRIRPTSLLKTQRGASGDRSVNQLVREWLHAVDLLLGPDTDLSIRAVLYALAEAAVLTDSLTLEHGNRSLATATGLNHRTVGRALKQLMAEPADRALIDLVQPAARTRANVYRLTIPPLLRAACAEKPWRRGRIHAVRPAFRELGLPAAFVYAALEQADTALGGRELAALARIGVTATYEALQVLSTHGLATRTDHGWVIGSASLPRLAEAWGIVEKIREELERHRAERRAWWAWLNRHTPLVVVTDDYDPTPPPPPDWISQEPPDRDQSTLEILQRILGATVINQDTA